MIELLLENDRLQPLPPTPSTWILLQLGYSLAGGLAGWLAGWLAGLAGLAGLTN